MTALLALRAAFIPEVGAACLFGFMAVRSFLVWRGRVFRATSVRDQILYPVHVAARVGLWLGFAALFLGYALVDQPRDVAWFIVVPMAMAGVQLITGLALGHGGRTEEWPRRDE